MTEPLLEVKDLHASYGQVRVLHGVDFRVDAGEIAVLLGANGAGKTTTIRALCGMVDTTGSVRFEGRELVGTPTEQVVGLGVAHVPQGRGTFPELTVVENLEVGAFSRRDRHGIREDVEAQLLAFPRLGERRTQQAGSLSGGEQQMLAIARALMSRPKLLLLDEPSLGLAPLITKGLFERLAELNQEIGTSIFVVEQNANLALSVANRAYVLEAGKIVLSGAAADLQADDAVRRAYLGF